MVVDFSASKQVIVKVERYSNLKLALSITLFHFTQSYMQVLVSRNEQLRTTTIIVHNTLPWEYEFIRAAVTNRLFKRISLHPVFIFALAINVMYLELLPSLSTNATDAAKPINQAVQEEPKNVDIEAESKLALHRQHWIVQFTEYIERALHEISNMKLWCKEFDSCGHGSKERELYKSAGFILLDYLSDLEDVFIHAKIRDRKSQPLAQAYKQSVKLALSLLASSL